MDIPTLLGSIHGDIYWWYPYIFSYFTRARGTLKDCSVDTAREANFCKAEKMWVLVTEVKFLCHVISQEGVAIDPSKVEVFID